MSIYRWSLPGRSQSRGKSPETVSDHQEKFSTARMSQPKLHRRGNLSSVFSNMFEKEENHKTTENAIPAPELKQYHAPASQTTTPSDADSTHSDITLPTQATWPNIRRRGVDFPFVPMPGAVGSMNCNQHEIRRESEHVLFPPEEDGDRVQNLGSDMTMIKPITDIRADSSPSSSYPSEGIRSPWSNQGSPEPSDATKAFISDLVRISSLPMKLLSAQPGTSESHSPLKENHGHDFGEELETTSGIASTNGSEIDSASRNADCVPTKVVCGGILREIGIPQVKFSSWPSKGHGMDTECLRTFLGHECHGHVMDPPESFSQSRFPATYLPVLAETSVCEPNDDPLRSNIASTTSIAGSRAEEGEVNPPDMARGGCCKHTRPSSCTSASQCSYSTANAEDIDSHEMPMLYRLTRVPSSGNNASPISFAQRIQKFRIEKWAKSLCKRSKVRFQHAIKKTPSSVLGRRFTEPGASRNKKPKISARAEIKRKNSIGIFWARDKISKKTGPQKITHKIRSRYADSAIGRRRSLMAMRKSRRAKKSTARGYSAARKRAVSWPA